MANNDNIIPILMELKDQVARADATSRLEHAANQKRLDEIAARLTATNADLAENKAIAAGNADKIKIIMPHIETLSRKKAFRDALKQEAAAWTARFAVITGIVTPIAATVAWIGCFEPFKRLFALFR